ncbi:hypothetical protein FQR65_LT01180 [Abscondita terminalis]|nr:hypothetical protein FQR65_LT01180 [Abscondita terminalis]
MPRIDPLQLLNCLQVLLSPNGGILSKNEVHRLASLMTKFSKKLVSKCVYVLILKNTEVTLLGLFMAAGGWTLIHLWLHDAIYTMNWALVKELLELLLLTPVDVERLKSNNIPKLVKSLSKREDLQGVHELSNQLVQQWLKIVKDETQYEINSQQQRTVTQSMVVSEEVNQHAGIQQEHHQTEQMGEDDVVENEEYDSGINSQTFYKLTLKDGKHLISKVGATDTNFQVLENVEVVEMKDDEDVKDKEKKKSSHDKSKHKSSSSKSSGGGSSSSSRDKDRSSHKVKSKHSSSSKDKDRSRDKHKHDKSKDKDRHRSNGSVSKSSSKSSSGSSSSSSKDKKDSKDKQAEKDKDTLSKIQPYTLQKLPKIPKKSSEEKDKSKDKKDDSKRGSISVEVRKSNEERPKTVKVYKSKMRSTGLEEEAKPAPPRPTKKPVTPPVTPVPSLKRTSPIRDLTPAAPPEKKTKIDPPLERPGVIKLIPPKPKPAVLQESDMFMDALTASATTKKEPKKRKRRASVSKDSTGTSPPSSPKEAVPSLKNLSPPKFYQDTLETEEAKANSENLKPTSDSEDNAKENNNASQVSERIPTPTEATAEEEDIPRTKNSNGLKGVLVYVRRKGPKKSIKWKPDEELVDIQYFELDETERVNVTKTFGDLAKMDVRGEREALQMSRKLQNEDVMDVHTIWRIPFEIDLPELLAEPGCKSLEKDIQFAREKSVLQAIYFNKKMLPETPAEPDPEMYQVKDPIIIPVDAADNPDHDFRDTPWPEPKGSPPPQNIPNNVSTVFPNVQGPFTNFPMTGAPNFQNMQNMPNVQQPYQGPPFMQQNVMGGGGGGGEWNNVNMPNMHNQMMPRNMPPPEMMNQGLMNPNMFIPPQENFNPMMNDNNHRFPPPFNNQGPGMFPNNFNRGGMGGFRRGGGGGGGGGNGPWLRMNVPSPGNWNVRNGGPPHRGGGRICHHFRNKGFCKNGDSCIFFHPNN